MRTIIIQIGNSDDKLTQAEWSLYCRRVQAAINGHLGKIHFAGGSDYHMPWQNACWVVELGPAMADCLRAELVRVREEFRQDSLAWTEGETAFV